jgi:hypothetical protein
MPTFRAGFEPRRAVATALDSMVLRTISVLNVATRTHGSNPARRYRYEMARQGRAEIFALPSPPTIPLLPGHYRASFPFCRGAFG